MKVQREEIPRITFHCHAVTESRGVDDDEIPVVVRGQVSGKKRDDPNLLRLRERAVRIVLVPDMLCQCLTGIRSRRDEGQRDPLVVW